MERRRRFEDSSPNRSIYCCKLDFRFHRDFHHQRLEKYNFSLSGSVPGDLFAKDRHFARDLGVPYQGPKSIPAGIARRLSLTSCRNGNQGGSHS